MLIQNFTKAEAGGREDSRKPKALRDGDTEFVRGKE